MQYKPCLFVFASKHEFHSNATEDVWKYDRWLIGRVIFWRFYFIYLYAIYGIPSNVLKYRCWLLL